MRDLNQWVGLVIAGVVFLLFVLDAFTNSPHRKSSLVYDGVGLAKQKAVQLCELELWRTLSTEARDDNGGEGYVVQIQDVTRVDRTQLLYVDATDPNALVAKLLQPGDHVAFKYLDEPAQGAQPTNPMAWVLMHRTKRVIRS